MAAAVDVQNKSRPNTSFKVSSQHQQQHLGHMPMIFQYSLLSILANAKQSTRIDPMATGTSK